MNIYTTFYKPSHTALDGIYEVLSDGLKYVKVGGRIKELGGTGSAFEYVKDIVPSGMPEWGEGISMTSVNIDNPNVEAPQSYVTDDDGNEFIIAGDQSTGLFNVYRKNKITNVYERMQMYNTSGNPVDGTTTFLSKFWYGKTTSNLKILITSHYTGSNVVFWVDVQNNRVRQMMNGDSGGWTIKADDDRIYMFSNNIGAYTIDVPDSITGNVWKRTLVHPNYTNGYTACWTAQDTHNGTVYFSANNLANLHGLCRVTSDGVATVGFAGQTWMWVFAESYNGNPIIAKDPAGDYSSAKAYPIYEYNLDTGEITPIPNQFRWSHYYTRYRPSVQGRDGNFYFTDVHDVTASPKRWTVARWVTKENRVERLDSIFTDSNDVWYIDKDSNNDIIVTGAKGAWKLNSVTDTWDHLFNVPTNQINFNEDGSWTVATDNGYLMSYGTVKIPYLRKQGEWLNADNYIDWKISEAMSDTPSVISWNNIQDKPNLVINNGTSDKDILINPATFTILTNSKRILIPEDNTPIQIKSPDGVTIDDKPILTNDYSDNNAGFLQQGRNFFSVSAQNISFMGDGGTEISMSDSQGLSMRSNRDATINGYRIHTDELFNVDQIMWRLDDLAQRVAALEAKLP